MHIHTRIHIHIHVHTHTPACAWACGAWHRRMHNESEWQQQLQSRSILYGRRCHNYDHNQRTHKGAMAREGVGGWMIAWAAVALAVASLSGLLLLICRNYSPSHSNIYENFFLLHQNLCATCSPCPCGRAKGGAQPPTHFPNPSLPLSCCASSMAARDN